MQYILIFLDGIVPKDDSLLNYLRLLHDLVTLVLYDRYSEKDLHLLKVTIKNHNILYSQLFNDRLKPKHHILTHYTSVIKNSGPLKYIWCMRTESKNREMKLYTNSINCRKNLPFSLSQKLCFKFAQFLLENKDLPSDVRILKEKSIVLNEQFYFNDITNLFLLNTETKVMSVEDMYFKGTLFKKAYYIYKEDAKQIYKIIDILHYDKAIIYLILQGVITKYDGRLKIFIHKELIMKYDAINLNTYWKNSSLKWLLKPLLPHTSFNGGEFYIKNI